MYGSAIWNHWLDAAATAPTWCARRGQRSQRHGRLRAAAYDDRDSRGRPGGHELRADFAEFAAATAEWRPPDSGIREGVAFPMPPASPEMPRGTPAAGCDDRAVTTLNHTAFALFDVQPSTG